MDRQDSGSHLSEPDSEGTCVGTEDESLPKKKARKNEKTYIQKYRSEWELMPEFGQWLLPFAIKRSACKFIRNVYVSKRHDLRWLDIVMLTNKDGMRQI